MFYLVFGALVIISTLHIYRHCKFCGQNAKCDFEKILSIKMINFRAHWLGCSQYLTVWPCFRPVLREFDHFYTSDWPSLHILRAFRQYFYIFFVFPLIQFRNARPLRETMVLTEGVNISISTHNWCPPPWRWIDAPDPMYQVSKQLDIPLLKKSCAQYFSTRQIATWQSSHFKFRNTEYANYAVFMQFFIWKSHSFFKI